MEEDYEPAVQHQRRVNPKIHDVIKKEVEKLLDAGLIYPISDSPWVSPVHCVPKKGGMTVVTNDDNELVPTRLVTGWRIVLIYRKCERRRTKTPSFCRYGTKARRDTQERILLFPRRLSRVTFKYQSDPKNRRRIQFTCPYRTFCLPRMPFAICKCHQAFSRVYDAISMI
ncbi:hypothetical protein Tco_0545344 [Tanacetum coccineum]